MSMAKVFTAVVVVALVAGGAYYLYQPAEGKPAPAAAKATNKALVFTSPPRESAEKGAEIYGPIAEYLSKVTGRRVVYVHPPTWGLYRTEMLNGDYDIVFDGGHFADYRARKLGHHIVAKMPALQQFVIVARKDDNVTAVDQLAGQTFCSPPSPNQGALLALSQFKDPARQPITVPITSKFWPSVYEGVVSGRCRGGVMEMAILQKLDKAGVTRIVLQTPPQPNQAFTVSSRVDAADRAKIAAALIAPEAAKPTEKLRERFKVGDSFVAANNAEYAGLGDLLKNEFGFESIASN
ncbi:MAG TPA: PhnD/SsuA/transferrin family substrate-binding protein [Burkholderiales bacterium]|nr:PhnD/SsuA/transferrin family substrate-binding protein [Burkholderiales bacterium]